MLVVTLADSTPVHEADRLQADLRRAGIEAFGRLINASLTTRQITHPVLRARAVGEQTHIPRVRKLLAQRTWLVGWQPEPPVGTAALRQLASNTAVAVGAE
jgi:arsenite-transporting ATPase